MSVRREGRGGMEREDDGKAKKNSYSGESKKVLCILFILIAILYATIEVFKTGGECPRVPESLRPIVLLMFQKPDKVSASKILCYVR